MQTAIEPAGAKASAAHGECMSAAQAQLLHLHIFWASGAILSADEGSSLLRGQRRSPPPFCFGWREESPESTPSVSSRTTALSASCMLSMFFGNGSDEPAAAAEQQDAGGGALVCSTMSTDAEQGTSPSGQRRSMRRSHTQFLPTDGRDAAPREHARVSRRSGRSWCTSYDTKGCTSARGEAAARVYTMTMLCYIYV